MNYRSPTIRLYKILDKRALLLILLIFSGCSLQTGSPPTMAWQQHQRQLQQFSRYQAKGCLTYRTPQRTLYARFTWQQQATNHYRWYLISPLGQTLLQVTQQGNFLQLVDHQGEIYQGSQALQWLKQYSGLDFSLTHLALWLIGLPGSQDQYQLGPQQRLLQLQPQFDPQLQVNYLTYRSYGRLILPSKLRLQRQTEQITLTIHHWSYTQ